MEDNRSFKVLLEKYITNAITAQERAWLLDMIVQDEYHAQLEQVLDQDFAEDFTGEPEDAVLRELIFSRIQEQKTSQIQEESPVIPLERRSTKRFYWWAAAVLLIAATSLIFFLPGLRRQQQLVVRNDVAPGGNRAVLTLGNGQQIVLDDAANGTLSRQGNTAVVKSGTGQLVYTVQQGNSREVVYNTITTPAGGQYQVILPDGSRVWLNARSSLRYPTAFSGNDRRVELTGEGYFEVNSLPLANQDGHTKKMPFHVTAGTMEVAVLGTHFNVMAYPDENAIKTTLLEGAVQLHQATTTVAIKPGEEGNIDKGSQHFRVVPGDMEGAIAWKNGLFHFENADIQTISRQIARWYDVDIVFEGQLPTRRFVGVMSRNVPLSSVIKILEATDVHFKINGRKLIIEQTR
jgi:transmembrane sensor